MVEDEKTKLDEMNKKLIEDIGKLKIFKKKTESE